MSERPNQRLVVVFAQGVDTGDKRAASQALADYIYDRVVEVYKPIAHCNVPGGEPQPLPANAMAPKKPDIVPR